MMLPLVMVALPFVMLPLVMLLLVTLPLAAPPLVALPLVTLLLVAPPLVALPLVAVSVVDSTLKLLLEESSKSELLEASEILERRALSTVTRHACIWWGCTLYFLAVLRTL